MKESVRPVLVQFGTSEVSLLMKRFENIFSLKGCDPNAWL